MADVRINLKSLNKDVLVSVPDDGDLKESFNEAASYIRTLEANNQIRDFERGVNPQGATHEVTKDRHGNYRLNRIRFSGL